MSHYRCYFLGKDHAIVAAEDFEAPSDEQAREKAEQLFRGRRERIAGFEVWTGARRIHRHVAG